MKHRSTTFLMSLVILLVWFATSSATVELNVANTLKLKEKPRDAAMSRNGRWIYVLTEKGEILIYTSNGKLKETIIVGEQVESIQVGPREDVLLLTSGEEKTVQIITLDFVQVINISGSPYKGKADAPVVVAIYNDFQWPYCAKLVPVLEQVLERNPENVKIVFKHFPLRNHKFARSAAIASLAAERQDKFWEFHDLLFKHYNQLNTQKVKEIAEQLKLDIQKFEQDQKDPKIATIINRDLSEGSRVGVRGTPTVFINGRLLRNRTLAGFQAMIRKSLPKTDSPSSQ